MKIALVKQEVYPDLYVCSNIRSPKDILFSSTARVGPIGLFTLLNADFHIVKESFTPECQIWRKVIPEYSGKFEQLVDRPINKVEGFEYRQPGVNNSNGDFAVSVEDINWSVYDVVISINCSVPTKIVRETPKTLWAYMIGEANVYTDKVYFSYDVCLNQENRGIMGDRVGVIDFPYTFLGPDCLEKIMRDFLKRPSNRHGVFAEVNTTKERPVKQIPHFVPISARTGHSIRIHKQLISENLTEVYDAKYFVKVGGRPTRGNGVIESISLGTPVLMNPFDMGSTQLLPKESWVFSVEDAIHKIRYYDSNPEAYNDLLNKQRDLLKQFIQDYPLESVKNALLKKQKKPYPRRNESLKMAVLKSRVKNLLGNAL